ncbi:MAG: hypothetical protein H6647_20845 [Anaerolineales bacterium]|nr:hypothetical protein [Anaerolineales bacterium]
MDLFCGSAVVSWFLAEHTENVVLAADLQLYAVTLAQAVLTRTRSLIFNSCEKSMDREAQHEYT